MIKARWLSSLKLDFDDLIASTFEHLKSSLVTLDYRNSQQEASISQIRK
jgi:hypothetical protein